MKYLKKFLIFEDGDGAVNASSCAGMGDVVSAQPGEIAGTTGTTGSGDIGFTFKKERRRKGKPSQVTDLRDLKDEKTNKIKESI